MNIHTQITPRYIITKFLRTSHIGENLKSSQKKGHIGTKAISTTDFSENTQARRQ